MIKGKQKLLLILPLLFGCDYSKKDINKEFDNKQFETILLNNSLNYHSIKLLIYYQFGMATSTRFTTNTNYEEIINKLSSYDLKYLESFNEYNLDDKYIAIYFNEDISDRSNCNIGVNDNYLYLSIKNEKQTNWYVSSINKTIHNEIKSYLNTEFNKI